MSSRRSTPVPPRSDALPVGAYPKRPQGPRPPGLEDLSGDVFRRIARLGVEEETPCETLDKAPMWHYGVEWDEGDEDLPYDIFRSRTDPHESYALGAERLLRRLILPTLSDSPGTGYAHAVGHKKGGEFSVEGWGELSLVPGEKWIASFFAPPIWNCESSQQSFCDGDSYKKRASAAALELVRMGAYPPPRTRSLGAGIARQKRAALNLVKMQSFDSSTKMWIDEESVATLQSMPDTMHFGMFFDIQDVSFEGFGREGPFPGGLYHGFMQGETSVSKWYLRAAPILVHAEKEGMLALHVKDSSLDFKDGSLWGDGNENKFYEGSFTGTLFVSLGLLQKTSHAAGRVSDFLEDPDARASVRSALHRVSRATRDNRKSAIEIGGDVERREGRRKGREGKTKKASKARSALPMKRARVESQAEEEGGRGRGQEGSTEAPLLLLHDLDLETIIVYISAFVPYYERVILLRCVSKEWRDATMREGSSVEEEAHRHACELSWVMTPRGIDGLPPETDYVQNVRTDLMLTCNNCWGRAARRFARMGVERSGGALSAGPRHVVWQRRGEMLSAGDNLFGEFGPACWTAPGVPAPSWADSSALDTTLYASTRDDVSSAFNRRVFSPLPDVNGRFKPMTLPDSACNFAKEQVHLLFDEPLARVFVDVQACGGLGAGISLALAANGRLYVRTTHRVAPTLYSAGAQWVWSSTADLLPLSVCDETDAPRFLHELPEDEERHLIKHSVSDPHTCDVVRMRTSVCWETVNSPPDLDTGYDPIVRFGLRNGGGNLAHCFVWALTEDGRVWAARASRGTWFLRWERVFPEDDRFHDVDISDVRALGVAGEVVTFAGLPCPPRHWEQAGISPARSVRVLRLTVGGNGQPFLQLPDTYRHELPRADACSDGLSDILVIPSQKSSEEHIVQVQASSFNFMCVLTSRGRMVVGTQAHCCDILDIGPRSNRSSKSVIGFCCMPLTPEVVTWTHDGFATVRSVFNVWRQKQVDAVPVLISGDRSRVVRPGEMVCAAFRSSVEADGPCGGLAADDWPLTPRGMCLAHDMARFYQGTIAALPEQGLAWITDGQLLHNQIVENNKVRRGGRKAEPEGTARFRALEKATERWR